MGKHVRRLLKFAIQYPGWHSYGTDRTTVDAVNCLVGYDLIRVNEFRQFQLALPDPPKERVVVSIITNGVIESMSICESKESAEKLFIETCSLHVPNWDKFLPEAVQDIIDGGYAETSMNGSICLSWAAVAA